jgi:hypothetical protein
VIVRGASTTEDHPFARRREWAKTGPALGRLHQLRGGWENGGCGLGLIGRLFELCSCHAFAGCGPMMGRTLMVVNRQASRASFPPRHFEGRRTKKEIEKAGSMGLWRRCE